MLSPASPESRRERILMMGPFGCGKTTNWLNIAKWAAATGSPAKFFAIDTDNALEAFLEPGSQYAELDARRGGNIHWMSVYEWPEYIAAANAFAPQVGFEDWIICDFVSPSWEAVQSYYISEIFKTDSDEFFLEARRNLKGGNALDGWKDWSVINRLYKKWINTVLNTGGHKFLTAQADSMRDSDDRALRAMFGAFGVRPKGQKELGYQAHTILLGAVNRAGETSITTVKDRERIAVADKPVQEFTIDYLTQVAGWTL